MGLHALNLEGGTLSHHCNNPDCLYHNCANWEAYQSCTHHDVSEYVLVTGEEMRERLRGAVPDEHLAKIGDTILTQPTTLGRKEGETRHVPIDHPDIVFTGPDVVALPMCECGTRMFLKVDFTEQELAAPNIQIVERHPDNPTVITRVTQHPMVERHQQLAATLRAAGRGYVTPPPPPVPSVADIMTLVEALKARGIDLGDTLPPAA